MPHVALFVLDDLPGIQCVPVAIQFLSRDAELDNEVFGKVLRLLFPSFLAPESPQGIFIGAHDDSGIGAANKKAAAYVRPSLC
jgi:hypothetical protein